MFKVKVSCPAGPPSSWAWTCLWSQLVDSAPSELSLSQATELATPLLWASCKILTIVASLRLLSA